MNEITITIAGPNNSGKSAIAEKLGLLLADHRIQTTLEDDIVLVRTNEMIDQILGSLKMASKVYIKVVTTRKG